MKPVIVFACLILLLASCATPEKLISRKWTVVEASVNDSLNPLSQMQKEILNTALTKNVFFTMKPDSTYIVQSNKQIVTGKWWFSANKKTVYTVPGESSKVDAKILKLSKQS